MATELLEEEEDAAVWSAAAFPIKLSLIITIFFFLFYCTLLKKEKNLHFFYKRKISQKENRYDAFPFLVLYPRSCGYHYELYLLTDDELICYIWNNTTSPIHSQRKELFAHYPYCVVNIFWEEDGGLGVGKNR